MTLELKLYLKNNVKPKIKYIICETNKKDKLILTSDNIRYIKGEDNLYNIQMNYVVVKQAPLSYIDGEYIETTMPNETIDPNEINFDGTMIVYLYDNITIDDLDSEELWIMPTFGDLKFKLKLTNNICINISN